jgi:hypothetical protein
MFGAYPDMQWKVVKGRFVQTARHRVEVGPVLLKRARRNLNAIARFQEPARYAEEYAKDLLSCSVEHGTDFVGVEVVETPPCGTSEVEQLLAMPTDSAARQVVQRCLAGRHGWQDEDGFAEQMAINHVFAGSEAVARAYLAGGGRAVVCAQGGLRFKVARGMNLLAGKTSKDAALKTQSFVCAEKYWSHIEVVLRKMGELVQNQRWLGLRVAQKALQAGDWI